MKISEIEKLTIDEILEKFDFIDAFIEDFKVWCGNQKPTSDSFFGVNREKYSKNPFLDLIPKEPVAFDGKYLPVPILVGNKEEDEDNG